MSEPRSEEALTSPSAARNREPILAVLRRALPERGHVLEIASGNGGHAVYFAAALRTCFGNQQIRTPSP
jgi:hypothetical protein